MKRVQFRYVILALVAVFAAIGLYGWSVAVQRF